MNASITARRAWRSFRRWRRGRPFWAGLLCILSGGVYFLSVHLDLSMHVQFGPQGFLSWLIPLMMLLCGVLLWVSPPQRIFYGVIAAATAVYGLIGLNLGGFFFGMLLGIMGGALAIAWTPVQLPPEPAAPYQPPPGDDVTQEHEGLPAAVNEMLSGPLTDTLPTSQVSPLAEPAPAPEPSAGGTWADVATEPPPGNGGRGPRLTGGLTVIVLAALAFGLLTLPQPPAAQAAPCTTTASPTPSATGTAGKPASPSPSSGKDPGSPAPSPSPSDNGGLLSGIINGIGKILGLGDDPSPSPSASPSTADGPSPHPTGTGAEPAPTGASPSPTTGCSGGAAQPKASVPAGLKVNSTPSHQITAFLYQTGLSYEGIATLPTGTGGTIQALQFNMDSSQSTPFELQSPFGGKQIDNKSSQLTVSGHVTFYTTKISGLLFGLIPTTYTVDSPPLLVTPIVWFTDATVELVFVTADRLTADNLDASLI